ncbi:MAG: hypothetical protein IPL52_04275 [Flavobacteriales bacterium]|nr:hypothetical protein [Flavobacteriales bacterium]
MDLGMYEEATAHFRNGMSYPAGMLFFRLNLRTGLAETFLKQHLPDSALLYLREAEGMADENKVEGCTAEIHGLMAEAYVQKGDYGPVFEWWEEALAKHTTIAWFGQIEAREAGKYGRALLTAPAEALRATGMDRTAGQKRAGEVLRHALRIGRDLALLDEQSEALLGLSELAVQQGDSASALRFHVQYTLIKDSILDADKAKVFALMQVRFQTERKEQQIVLLGKDKEVQAKEIQKQKLVRNGFMGGFAFVALFAGVFLFQRNRISKEKKRSEELLLNILPEEVAEELKAKGEADAKQIDQVTVLFTDFKGFTAMSEKLTPKQLVR